LKKPRVALRLDQSRVNDPFYSLLRLIILSREERAKITRQCRRSAFGAARSAASELGRINEAESTSATVDRCDKSLNAETLEPPRS